MTRTSTTAWVVVLLLMPVALLNYLDRQMMASMKSSVMDSIPELAEADNKEALWGFMLGQFKWVYALCSLCAGLVADRLGRKRTICLSLFVWSAVTWWTGRVSSYSELVQARSWMGISEAFYIPAALALISELHAANTRSRAVGLHQMAIYVGVIAGGFGGYVAASPTLGWRWAFSYCGLFGMLYAVPLFLLLREPTRDPLQTQQLTSSPRVLVQELVANPSYLLLVFYFTLPALAGWVVRDWMPAILKDKFNLGQGRAGVAASLYWQLAAIGGAMLGGWLADGWLVRDQRARIYVSALGMAMIVPAIVGVGSANSLLLAVLFLILFGLGWGFFDANNMPILSQIVRPELRATGYGLMNFVSISAGGLADWGFGILRDRQVPLPYIFGGFAGLAMVSILLVLKIRPRSELSLKESSA